MLSHLQCLARSGSKQIVDWHPCWLLNFHRLLVYCSLQALRGSQIAAQSLCPKSLLLRLLCRQEGQEALSTEEVAQLKAALPSFLLFATTWSVGASCDKTGRIAFDMFLKSKAAGRLV